MATKRQDKNSKLWRLLRGKSASSDIAPDLPKNPGRATPPGRISRGGNNKSSYLVEDNTSMDRKRRQMEQDGHRHLAKVNAREHNETDPDIAPEGDLQNSIQQHPWLEAQRFDGIDPNLNPEPPLNTAARREFDNERREQEMEKQLRLGNMPKFSSAPKPSPK
jgi:hypothetical protein